MSGILIVSGLAATICGWLPQIWGFGESLGGERDPYPPAPRGPTRASSALLPTPAWGSRFAVSPTAVAAYVRHASDAMACVPVWGLRFGPRDGASRSRSGATTIPLISTIHHQLSDISTGFYLRFLAVLRIIQLLGREAGA